MSVQIAKRAMAHLQYLIFLTAIVVKVSAYAQTPAGSEGGRNQIGIFTGRVLPNGIDGAPEIFSLTGLRYSRSFSENSNGLWELGAVAGNSTGVKWTGLSASLRMDVPIETLVGLAYLGLDYTRYEGVGVEANQKGGAHVGGGLLTWLGGDTHFRFDMKLNSKPGTSLFFSLGLVFDF